MLTLEEIKKNLCYNDLRNPYATIDEEATKENANCYCDNCFRGKTVLAEELLRYYYIVNNMDKDKLKGAIASELIIVATETKGKRPTQLNFEEMIDVVADVVNKISANMSFISKFQEIIYSDLSDLEIVNALHKLDNER